MPTTLWKNSGSTACGGAGAGSIGVAWAMAEEMVDSDIGDIPSSGTAPLDVSVCGRSASRNQPAGRNASSAGTKAGGTKWKMNT